MDIITPQQRKSNIYKEDKTMYIKKQIKEFIQATLFTFAMMSILLIIALIKL